MRKNTMKTKIIDARAINKAKLEQAYVLDNKAVQREIEIALREIRQAGLALKNGATVAFPTETVYGLGANALDNDAVARIFRAKNRPSDNPLICHIGRASDISELSNDIDPNIVKLMDNFWPGPLTIILNKNQNIPNITTASLSTVAIRLPDNEIAIELIRAAGVPVAAPSANLSGSPSPTTFEHVLEDLDGRVDFIIRGDKSPVGIESTVLDMTCSTPKILRPGIITPEMVRAVLNVDVSYDEALLSKTNSLDNTSVPKAPGMKYKHYSPKAQLVVVEGQRDMVINEINRLKEKNEGLGLKVGIILFEEDEYIRAAHDFYARLRDLDSTSVDIIFAGALSYKDGVGFAVMNRMLHSAGYNVVKV
jgi:L-threonylcarbamoyladenylate synthase